MILNMTDLEFDLLDELYFVISFQSILVELNWSSEVLTQELEKLLHKEWIKTIETETMLELTHMPPTADFHKYLFLATKKGLLAHNCKD